MAIQAQKVKQQKHNKNYGRQTFVFQRRGPLLTNEGKSLSQKGPSILTEISVFSALLTTDFGRTLRVVFVSFTSHSQPCRRRWVGREMGAHDEVALVRQEKG